MINKSGLENHYMTYGKHFNYYFINNIKKLVKKKNI